MNNWNDVIIRDDKGYIFMSNMGNERRTLFEQAVAETNSDVILGENAVDCMGNSVDNCFVIYKPIEMCDFSKLWKVFRQLKVDNGIE